MHHASVSFFFFHSTDRILFCYEFMIHVYMLFNCVVWIWQKWCNVYVLKVNTGQGYEMSCYCVFEISPPHKVDVVSRLPINVSSKNRREVESLH